MTEERKKLPGDTAILYFVLASYVVMCVTGWFETFGFIEVGTFVYACAAVLVSYALCWNRVRRAEGKATKLIPVTVGVRKRRIGWKLVGYRSWSLEMSSFRLWSPETWGLVLCRAYDDLLVYFVSVFHFELIITVKRRPGRLYG